MYMCLDAVQHLEKVKKEIIMAKLLNNQNCTVPSKRATLEGTYNTSVHNLLLVIAFSVINIVLLVANASTYFLFSAFIPYFITDCGMFFSGSYPAEYYYDMGDFVFSNKSFLTVTVVIAAIILLLYFLCWFFAKKQKVGWLIAAAVLFGVDTLAMFALNGFSIDSILDVVFHIWVIWSLINGIITYYKLKKLPEEDLAENEEAPEVPSGESTMLRWADTEVKAKELLRADTPGYQIVYRRVKRTNELVINGKVYDEYVALMEFPHTLSAVVDGHTIEVQYDSSCHMYMYFDNALLAKKLRLF